MNYLFLFLIIVASIVVVWFGAVYYHVLKYRMPNDKSQLIFSILATIWSGLFLVFVFYLSGIDWSIL